MRFSPDTLDGPVGELPRAEDLDAAAQLVSEQGVLSAIGFPDRMPAPARKLLTGLAIVDSASTFHDPMARLGGRPTIAPR